MSDTHRTVAVLSKKLKQVAAAADFKVAERYITDNLISDEIFAALPNGPDKRASRDAENLVALVENTYRRFHGGDGVSARHDASPSDLVLAEWLFDNVVALERVLLVTPLRGMMIAKRASKLGAAEPTPAQRAVHTLCREFVTRECGNFLAVCKSREWAHLKTDEIAALYVDRFIPAACRRAALAFLLDAVARKIVVVQRTDQPPPQPPPGTTYAELIEPVERVAAATTLDTKA